MSDSGSPRYETDASGAGRILGERPLLAVSNREPYTHEYDEDGEITVSRPAGGLTAGLDPLMQSLGGTWIAWGSGEADREVVDEADRVAVPPEQPGYDLRRLWLSDDEVDDYYYGYSNQVLWPLAHGMPSKLAYEPSFWRRYRDVNERFAEAVVEEARAAGTGAAGMETAGTGAVESEAATDAADRTAAGRADEPVVWFQDYHFGLAPRMVREQLPEASIMHFWHVPWPPWDVFRRGPHAREVLAGMLGSDLVSFHTPRDRRHFVECARAALDAEFDPADGVLRHDGARTAVRTHPLGIDGEDVAERADSAAAEAFWEEFAAERGLEDVRVLVGVDRLDYTKGIVERLAALERFLEEYPERRGEVSLVQKASESRSRIDAYQRVQQEVEAAIDRLNERFATDDWQPVHYVTDLLPEEGLAALYRNADVALVSSLRDGLNLVAKEYVAAQVDDDGALVLSRFAGVADELGDGALTVNPLDVEAFAATIERALSMPPARRRERMETMRRRVHDESAFRWVEDQFATLAEVEA